MLREASKSFKEYFFEFVMVFLAVTLGFFAENLRENHTERDEERQYAQSFCDDLASDQEELPELLESINRHAGTATDLQQLLPVGKTANDATGIYGFK